jgi:ABC-type nitrate/sulfonate/bicarbonate transport system substrate-binding protein
MSPVFRSFDRREFLRSAVGFSALAAAGGLAACSSGPTGGKSLQPVSFMLDYLPNPDDVFVQVGKTFGYYADEGVQLNTTVPPTDLELIPELVGRGQFDMGVSYAVNVTAARAKGIPVISVAGQGVRADGLITLAPAVIQSPHDLVGKTIATYASADYVGFITSVMRSGGLKLSDVKLVDVAFTPPVIISHRAYAGVGLKWGEFVVTEGTAHQKANFLSFFEPQFGIPPNQPYMSFITSEKFAHDHPDTVKAVVRASMRGIKKSLVDPSAVHAAQVPWDSTGAKAVGTIQINTQSFEAMRPYWFTSPTADPKTATYAVQDLAAWSKASNWLHSTGGIGRVPNPSSYVTNEFLTAGATNPAV